MGTSVISGITITKFLGVFVLLFATSQLFEVRGNTPEWGNSLRVLSCLLELFHFS